MKENTSIDESIYFASGIIKLHKYLTEKHKQTTKVPPIGRTFAFGEENNEKIKGKIKLILRNHIVYRSF